MTIFHIRILITNIIEQNIIIFDSEKELKSHTFVTVVA